MGGDHRLVDGWVQGGALATDLHMIVHQASSSTVSASCTQALPSTTARSSAELSTAMVSAKKRAMTIRAAWRRSEPSGAA